jgi:site-specific DNA-methyltransferase (adenine-specific)
MNALIKSGLKFDSIITDPPYGTTACKWDSVIPFDEMWKCLKDLRKEKTPVVLFGSEPFSSVLRCSNLQEFKYDWIWKKSNPSNIALANKQPMKYHEIISIFYNNQPVYNKQMIERISPRIKQAHDSKYVFHNSTSEQTGLKYIEVNSEKYDENVKNPSSIIEVNSLRPNAKEFVKHATQKPLELMEYLIKTYTNEGDTILDFTCGSGTTLVASKKLNRNCYGIELEEKYCEITKNRLLEI